MTRWVLLVVAVAVNMVAVAVALAPAFVTYAERVPAIHCESCSSPEVRKALTEAAAVGRAQMAGSIHSNSWLLIALGVANIAIVAVLVWMLRSNSTVETDARRSGARGSP
jgi:hypothetical protein